MKQSVPVDRSHVVGATDIPLSDDTIPALLARAVAANPDRDAVIFREQSIRWTWRAFADQVDQLAAGLLARGIRRGDRVGIWSPNRAEWLVTQFATARIGAILVNINPAYRQAELDYALNKSGVRMLITATRFKSSLYIEMLQALAPELADATPGQLRASRLPNLQFVVRMGDDTTPGMLNYADLLQPAESTTLDALTRQLDPHDAINIQFTSGTTGNPKGATLTHHNVVNNGRFVAMAMRLGSDDRLCIPEIGRAHV